MTLDGLMERLRAVSRDDKAEPHLADLPLIVVPVVVLVRRG